MTISVPHIAVCAGATEFASSIVEKLEFCEEAQRQSLTQAFAKIPRAVFVDKSYERIASEDVSIPIGFEQTISRPSTVALMLAMLDVRRQEKVLEVGSGSGYVLALLTALGAHAFGVECRAELAHQARRRLDALNHQGVLLRCGDGAKGWQEFAPYNAIIASTAFQEVPRALLAQLDEGGRLIAPVSVSDDGADQRFEFWTRVSMSGPAERQFVVEDGGPCNFVLAE